MRDRKETKAILSIQIIGGLALRLGERSVTIPSRKSRAILGYLALADTNEESRERLVGLLWSESESEKARASLRQCVHEIRDAFQKVGFNGLLAEKHSIALRKTTLRVDIWDVLAEAKSGRAHPRLLDSTGLTEQILTEVETVDPVYRTWLLAKRQSLYDVISRHLEAVLRVTLPTGEAGEDLAAAILNLDPTHEEACRFLMSTRAARGDISSALKIYNTLWQVLEDDYDVEPSGQTQQLVARIKMAEPVSGVALPNEQVAGFALAGTVVVAPSPPARIEAVHHRPHQPLSSKLLVSISPFDISGVDADRHYVVQGFRRELVASLVRFREWLVREQLTRTASADVRPDEYLLEADAIDAVDGVRLVLTLRECAGNTYLWSDHLHLSVANWSEAQQMVVRRIATALNVHVSEGRMALVAPKAGSDLLAYDLWLRGQAHFLTYEPPGWRKASELYREIVTQHPRFAPAYSSLAQLQNTVHFVHPGVFRSAHAAGEALSLAAEATRLDPIDSRAQLCLGWANAMSGRYDQAAIHHRLAYELNENDPWTLVSSALGFAFRGECKQARSLADHALELSPTPNGTHWRYQAMVRYMCRDFTGCVDAAEQAESSIQNVYVWKAAALHALGRKDDAKIAASKFFDAVEKRWFGPEVPSRRLMTRWILHGFPIMLAEDFERLRDDFGGAGAPVEEIDHNSW